MSVAQRVAALLAASATAAALFALFASGLAVGAREGLDAFAQQGAPTARAGWAEVLFGAITYLGWTPVLVAIAVAAGLCSNAWPEDGAG